MTTPLPVTTIRDVACTVCGCVCDDLAMTVAGGRITAVERACHLAEPWFLGQNATTPPIALERGQPVAYSHALDLAARILQNAQSPLIYGLSRSTTEGQRAATALADRLGATIDTTASTGHAPSIMALQQVGESTCSLGEVKQRADLVVFWGSDPLTTHPRHIERYCPPRSGRKIIVVDHGETETARLADAFYPISPGQDWEALWELHHAVTGSRHHREAERSPWQDLAEQMRACRFGIIFFGTRLTQGSIGHQNVQALLQLVTALNAHARFYARRMRRFGDVAGADSVLAWQTGYPFGVNLAAGYPRYNPGEFTGPEMLARHEVDAALIVGGETLADLPDAAWQHLRSIPTILLDHPEPVTDLEPTVHFTTAVYGVHRPGTAYRMDEIPIPLKVILPTSYPSDGDVLGEILQRCVPETA
jgi:formylmethanofuran dehydrogenase subunit B